MSTRVAKTRQILYSIKLIITSEFIAFLVKHSYRLNKKCPEGAYRQVMKKVKVIIRQFKFAKTNDAGRPAHLRREIGSFVSM